MISIEFSNCSLFLFICIAPLSCRKGFEKKKRQSKPSSSWDKMFLLAFYNVTSKQEYREQLEHWVWWTTNVLNAIQQKMCQEKAIQEYQSLLCWERWARGVLSAIHHSMNTCREAEEVRVSLLALLAASIKHELVLLFVVALGHISLEIQRL